jgi:hypothetical protein
MDKFKIKIKLDNNFYYKLLFNMNFLNNYSFYKKFLCKIYLF